MTDAELDQPATRRDLLDFATRRDLQQFATRSELLEMRDELRRHMDDRSEELRRHFDLVAESFKADFANLFDWTHSTTSTMGKRIDDLESRVERLEPRAKS